uniref:Chromosome 18 open reading frame 54 n=1 Tax=Chelonoidis abingdonii TaxID=106734 RepID=A0A8C0IQ60_CHEAB
MLSNAKNSIYSPESTVSSLLASCSLNSSNSYSNSSIQYKDKVYNSASQALEAYIEDFDQSLMSSEVSTGKICIGQSTPKDKSAKYGSVQKYGMFPVNEGFNQPGKLNSIASPFMRQTVCDPDLISLTTDDLLAFPSDGSLPFIHRIPSGSGLQSGKWIRNNGDTVCFLDDQIELLILKAKRTLESSVENLSSALKNDCSPCTVDILEAERSWENVPVAFKPPVPVYCEEDEATLQSPKANIVNEFLEDCLNNDNQENTFSGGNHHGPVEALKLMLFNLQAVHESFNKNKTAEQNDEFKKVSSFLLILALIDINILSNFSVGLYLALHHLSRLKGLVEDTSGKQDQKDYHQEDGKEKN